MAQRSIVLGVMVMLLCSCGQPKATEATAQQPLIRPKVVGFSYNPWHANWRAGVYGGQGFSPSRLQQLEEALKAGIDSVRIAVQWKDCEPEVGKYKFDLIDEALELCDQYKVRAVLTAGVKAPRWPEVYVPDQYRLQVKDGTTDGVKKELFAYLTAFLSRYGSDPRVSGFQVENEPFEPFGSPALAVREKTLKEEVEFLHARTKKALMVTMGAGTTSPASFNRERRMKILDQYLRLPIDRVGFNLYQSVRASDGIFGQWQADDANWKLAKDLIEKVRKGKKTPVIAELQAEPWEPDASKFDFFKPDGNPSFNPTEYRKLLVRAATFNCPEVYLWGLEFQTGCLKQGNHGWWSVTKEYVAKR